MGYLKIGFELVADTLLTPNLFDTGEPYKRHIVTRVTVPDGLTQEQYASLCSNIMYSIDSGVDYMNRQIAKLTEEKVNNDAAV